MPASRSRSAGCRQHAQRRPRPALLHHHRLEKRVARAGLQQPLEHVLVDLRIRVVDRRLEHHDLVRGERGHRIADHDAQQVRAVGEGAIARAVADRGEPERRRRVGPPECRDDRGAGRRDQLAFAVAGAHRPAAQEREHRRPGTGSGPWAAWITPCPIGSGLTCTASTPRWTNPSAAPTTSTMASSAPTSWNSTRSTGTPCDVRLGLGQAREDGEGALAHRGSERAAGEQIADRDPRTVSVMRCGSWACPWGGSGCWP